MELLLLMLWLVGPAIANIFVSGSFLFKLLSSQALRWICKRCFDRLKTYCDYCDYNCGNTCYYEHKWIYCDSVIILLQPIMQVIISNR